MLVSLAFLLLLAPAQPGAVELAQLTIERRVIIRVPLAREPARIVAPAPPPSDWDEKKGPKCVAVRSIRAASITDKRGIDLILGSGQRYRAHFPKSCRVADFWTGFYIEPPKDGSLCAGRDNLLARGGSECEIAAFRELVPED